MTNSPRNIVFIKRAAVRWLNLRTLADAAFKSVISTVIGGQTGRRETLAALDLNPRPENYENFRSERGDDTLWVDYIADLGDGFNATHSIAWLAGRDWLSLGEPGSRIAQPIPASAHSEVAEADHRRPGVVTTILPRADILVFGGDQVYPDASAQNYRERVEGPYYAARPWNGVDPEDSGRPLYAIPGNHDWYDGLTSFIRIFCQPARWIGGWRVRQRRSYFSLKLPHGFWLWGIDTALNEDIDLPQISYFEEQAKKLEKSDQVILCAPAPVWLKCTSDGSSGAPPPPEWEKMQRIARLVDGRGAVISLFLAGDLHHYARHAAKDGKRHFFTCGGGGAFTLGTRLQPKKITFPDGDSVRLKKTFPCADASRKMRRGAILAVFRYHRLLCAAFSAALLLPIWMLQSGGICEEPCRTSFLDHASDIFTAPLKTLSAVTAIAGHSPGAVLFLLLLGAGFLAFGAMGRDPMERGWKTILFSTLHFFIQFAVTVTICILALRLLDPALLPLGGGLIAGLLRGGIFAAGIGLGCWTASGVILGLYLWLSNIFINAHEQEVYSSQAIEDWKCFLRIKVSREGLIVYPVGLRHCATRWEPTLDEIRAAGPDETRRAGEMDFNSFPTRSEFYAVPPGTTHLFRPGQPLKPELLEPPICIKSAKGIDNA